MNCDLESKQIISSDVMIYFLRKQFATWWVPSLSLLCLHLAVKWRLVNNVLKILTTSTTQLKTEALLSTFWFNAITKWFDFIVSWRGNKGEALTLGRIISVAITVLFANGIQGKSKPHSGARFQSGDHPKSHAKIVHPNFTINQDDCREVVQCKWDLFRRLGHCGLRSRFILYFILLNASWDV